MGNHLFFSGVQGFNPDRVSIAVGGTNPELDITGDVTVEAIISPMDDGTGTIVVVVRCGVENDTRFCLLYQASVERIVWESYSGSFENVFGSSNTVPIGKTTHVVARRLNNEVTLFANGILVAGPTSVSTPTVQANELQIGGNSVHEFQDFEGSIDTVRVYSRALTDEEISEHARGIFSDNTDLLLLWKLDTGSGTTATDDSGNSNDGTISGATWVSGNLVPNRVIMTVWEHAGEVALDDPIQYTAAVIGGVASTVIAGNGKKRRRVRLFSNVDAWVKWGENPTATGGSDSMALSANNPEYVDIESGHILHAISR